jgi:hypothetical protein
LAELPLEIQISEVSISSTPHATSESVLLGSYFVRLMENQLASTQLELVAAY